MKRRTVNIERLIARRQNIELANGETILYIDGEQGDGEQGDGEHGGRYAIEAKENDKDTVLEFTHEEVLEYAEIFGLKPDWKHLAIQGVSVPYRNEMPTYVWDAEQRVFVERKRYPLYITHLLAGRYEQGITSAAKEMLLDWSRQSAVEIHGKQCVLLGSASIPRGCFYVDHDGFYRNEKEAEEQAQDFDGDNGHASAPVRLEDGFQWVNWNKWPKTAVHAPLKRIYELPAERYYPFPFHIVKEAMDAEAALIYDEKDAFFKTHQPNDTGLKTFTWNTKELFEASGVDDKGEFEIPELRDRIRSLFQDPERFTDIELNGLKGRSKDEYSTQKAEPIEGIKLSPRMNWLFSPKAIGGMRAEDVAWVWGEEDPGALIRRILSLDLEFDETSPQGPLDTSPKIYDTALFGRLHKLGLIGYEEIPSIREGLPPAVRIWLRRPGVGYCGMTDIKRGELVFTYAYVIPPVAKLIPATRGVKGEKPKVQLLHPLTALADRLAEFDNEIINPHTGDVTRLFPQHADDLSRYPGKRAALQKLLLELCGIYGDSVPCSRDRRGRISLRPLPLATLRRTIAIDYGTENLDTESMWTLACEVNKVTRIALSGGKGSHRRVRKYPLARANGTPLWADERDHPRRSANQRAQLMRGILPLDAENRPVKYRVAVVLGDTKTQVRITPSGIAKQRTGEGEIFLPPVGNVRDDERGLTKPHVYTNWAGELVQSWIGDPKETREIGKLLDAHGNKFIPARMPQAIGRATKEFTEMIDLLIPFDELVNKGSVRSLLAPREGEPARFERILIPTPDGSGQLEDAWIIDAEFYRSGSHSENVPQRVRTLRAKGTDRLCTLQELWETHPELLADEFCGLYEPDLAFGLELKEAILQLAASVGIDSEALESPGFVSFADMGYAGDGAGYGEDSGLAPLPYDALPADYLYGND